MRIRITLVAFLIATAIQLFADEAVRRAQEELRKRNLYFGDINGQTNPELVEALKRYQSRKGFPATGDLNDETARSLKIQVASNKGEQLPDLPVLKSDSARELAEPDRAALQSQLEEEPTSSPTPSGAATETPTQSEESRNEEISKFVQDYLRDAEGDDVDLQVSYYAFPVEYFDHGKASREFVTRDTRNYIKRWPERKYTLIGPVNSMSTKTPNVFQVEFTIAFRVAGGGRVAHGKTRNLWTIQSERNNFKILVINEQRLHD
jgi:peptidoglycan hydrolase-like protein with peptidoglycan-binding domain